MDDLLVLSGISKNYKRGDRRVSVLNNVNLRIGVREIGAIRASRNQGKTTLLQIATGLLRPDRGEVWFADINLTRCSDDQRARLLGHEIAWVHRDGSALDLTVLDYVALPLWTGHRWPLLRYRRGKREAEYAARLALERVGAADCAASRWRDLSNWERVLVAFARGIARRPRLLVLDDLLDGFGMDATRQAGELLLSFTQDLGCAILMTVCDIEAAGVARRVWEFEHGGLKLIRGQVDAEAEIVELHGDPRHQRSSRGTAS